MANMAQASAARNKLRLSDVEIETYRNEGLVIPEYRLAASKLGRLKEGLEQLIRDNPNVRGEKLISAHVTNNPAETVRGNQTIFDTACDSDILDLVECLIGADIILWGAQMFAKPAGNGKEVPWHQDGHYWPIRPLATCTVWIAVDDSTPENGAMRYVPGSHRAGLYPHRTDSSDALVLNQVLMDGSVDMGTAKDDVLEAGQFSMHDVYLVHGSPANRSNRRRAGLAIRYMPATSHFDRSIATRDKVANFAARPIWLVRGVDRTGKNDFTVGHLND
jgi:ectoine hydroxylase-related dioxygenase (phytanoyl-CoA dioxygenase family)